MKRKPLEKFSIVFALIIIGFVTLYAFHVQPAESLEPPPTDWSRTYGGTSDDSAEWVIQTSDGGYAIAGYTYSYGVGEVDSWLVKTDSAGQMRWNKAYGGSGGDYAESVVQTSDGGYALAGITDSFGVGREDFWLVKTDSIGEMLWSKTFGGAGMDWAHSVVQTSDSGYVLAGITNSSGAGSYDALLVKTDSAGNIQWNRTYGGANYEEARSLVQTSDGSYVFAGSTTSYGTGDHDFWLVKTDSDGNMQWNKTYGGPSTEVPFSVVQSKDGGYALAGSIVTSGAGVPPNEDFWLVKTDPSGDMQWSRAYGGTKNDGGGSVIQTNDGGYALIGYTYSYGAGQPSSLGTGESNIWLVKTDLSGNMQWSKAYGEDGGEAAFSVVQTIDGGYVIAGDIRSDSAATSDFWLVKIANGHAQGESGLLTVYVGLALAVAGAATVATVIYVKRVKR